MIGLFRKALILFSVSLVAGVCLGQEGRSLEEWRAICSQDASAQSGEMATLELGCAARTLFSGGGDGRRHYLANYPEAKKARATFDQWLTGEGAPKLEAWAQGTLAPEDEPYRSLIEAMALYRCRQGDLRNKTRNSSGLSAVDQAMVKYFENVQNSGEELLRKGYRGEAMTEEQIDLLHGLRMLTEINVRTGSVLPFQLGLTRNTPNNSVFDRGFQVGDASPEFVLPWIDTVAKRPEYQDEPYDYDPTAFLHRSSLGFFFDLFDGYKLQGGEVVARPLEVRKGEAKEDYFVYPGTGRPLVVMTVRVNDGWWFKIAGMDIAPLWHSYRDEVDFVIIHMTYSDPSADLDEVFGPLAGKSVCMMHQPRPEMLAREAKVFWMSQPCFSLPTAVDNISAFARNAVMTEAGDARTFIFDKDGKLAFEFSKWILESPAGWAGGSIYGNVMANRLDRLLENGGKHDGTPIPMDHRASDYLALEREIMAFDDDIVRTKAIVKSIDLATQTVLVELQNKSQHWPAMLKVGPHVLIERAESWAHVVPAAFSDIKAGDTLQVDFRLSQTDGEIRVSSGPQVRNDYFTYRSIMNVPGEFSAQLDRIIIGTGAAPLPNRGCVWSMGTVKSVDAEARTITFVNDAFVDEPTLGYRYWKQHPEARGNAETKEMLHTVTRWVEGSEADRTRTLHCTDGTFHFHHDRVGSLADLKPGTKIGAFYPAHFDELDVIQPYVVRSFDR